MLNNKVCQKNSNLWKSHILAKSQNSYTQIKIYSFFLNLCQKLHLPANVYENTIKNKFFETIFSLFGNEQNYKFIKKIVVRQLPTPY